MIHTTEEAWGHLPSSTSKHHASAVDAGYKSTSVPQLFSRTMRWRSSSPDQGSQSRKLVSLRPCETRNIKMASSDATSPKTSLPTCTVTGDRRRVQSHKTTPVSELSLSMKRSTLVQYARWYFELTRLHKFPLGNILIIWPCRELERRVFHWVTR